MIRDNDIRQTFPTATIMPALRREGKSVEDSKKANALERIFYPLADAAELVKCKPSDLLHYGGLGRIAITSFTPDRIFFHPFDFITNHMGYRDINPHMIALNRADCWQIECNSEIYQGQFRRAYLINKNNVADIYYPSQMTDRDDHTFVWQAFFQFLPTKLRLAVDSLFVMKSDLDDFMTGTYPRIDEEVQIRSAEKNNLQSDLLTILNQAYNFLWKNADLDEPDTWPANSVVAEWLTKRDKRFSQTLADKAATIIRPNAAPMGRPQRKSQESPKSTASRANAKTRLDRPDF